MALLGDKEAHIVDVFRTNPRKVQLVLGVKINFLGERRSLNVSQPLLFYQYCFDIRDMFGRVEMCHQYILVRHVPMYVDRRLVGGDQNWLKNEVIFEKY